MGWRGLYNKVDQSSRDGGINLNVEETYIDTEHDTEH